MKLRHQKFARLTILLAPLGIAFALAFTLTPTCAQAQPQTQTQAPTATPTPAQTAEKPASTQTDATASVTSAATAVPTPASSAPIDPLLTISKLPPIEPISLVPPKLLPDPFLNLGLSTETKPEPIIIDADLWNRMRNGFAMDSLDTPLVQEHEQWYAARPDHIRRLMERGAKYLHHIVEEVEKRGMPMEVALLPVIESAFNPQAYSRARAAGMWQFIPSTGKIFGLQQDALNDHRRDVLASTTAALAYLQKLYGMFNAWDLALAAYNCGEGCVGRAIAVNQKRGLPTNFLALNLPRETKQYVPKLLAIRNIVQSPGSFGLVLDAVPDQPYFAKVTAPARIDLKLAAHLAGLSLDDFKALNPSFNKPIAAGSLGYFLLPQNRAESFRQNLAAYEATRAPLVSWATYTARAGENLDVIGKRYGITGQALRFANPGLKERRGKLALAATLQVPLGRESASIEARMRYAAPVKPLLDSPRTLSTAAVVAPAARELVAAAGSTNTAQPTQALTQSATPAIAEAALKPSADVATASPNSISFSTYVVKSGDSIFSISKATGVLMADIKAFNNLSTNAIRVGQRLKLTGDIDSSSNNVPTPPANANLASSAPASTRIAAPTSIKPRATQASHTVRSGDTMSGIADKYNVGLSDLLRANGYTPRTVLKLGTKLKVPS